MESLPSGCRGSRISWSRPLASGRVVEATGDRAEAPVPTFLVWERDTLSKRFEGFWSGVFETAGAVGRGADEEACSARRRDTCRKPIRGLRR